MTETLDTDPSVPPLDTLSTQTFNSPISELLLRDSGRDRFDLSAPYQRGSVWGPDRQRALIRSILIGLPVGAICVSELPYRIGIVSDLRVIDGKQRIEAIRAFVGGELAVPGAWFRRGALIDGEAARSRMVTWDDLARPQQRQIENTPVAVLHFACEVSYTRDPDTGAISERHNLTDEEILAAEAEVFDLINFGGVPQGETDVVP